MRINAASTFAVKVLIGSTLIRRLLRPAPLPDLFNGELPSDMGEHKGKLFMRLRFAKAPEKQAIDLQRQARHSLEKEELVKTDNKE